MNYYRDCARNRRRVNFSMPLVVVVFLLSSCASGSGVNQNSYFKADKTQDVVVSIKIYDDTQPIMSSPTLNSDSDAFISSLVMGGIVGAYFSTNSAAWSAIRGKYAASEGFREATKRINASDTKQEIILKLDRFVYGIRPAKGFKSGGILSFMEFSSQFNNKPNKVWSAYACDLQIKGAFFPNDERNMLREMIEASLSHWARLLNSPDNVELCKTGVFPQKLKGDFAGDEAKCVYEVFVQEQERGFKLNGLNEMKP